MLRSKLGLGIFVALVLAATAPASEIRGVIRKVDKDSITLEARGRGKRGLPETIAIDRDTVVLLGKQPGKVADLVPGKRVRIVYEIHDGRPVALEITEHGVTPPAPNPVVPNDPNAITGTLRRVGITDREIVVIGPGKQGGGEVETIVQVPRTTKVLKEGQPYRFEDLKENEAVVVHAEKQNNRLIAQTIEVGAVNAAPAPGGNERKVEKVRQVLKMLDAFLQQVEKR